MMETPQRPLPTAAPVLRVRLLGPLEIRHADGDKVELPRKVRALFAYLVTRRGTTVPRQTLLGLLWRDRPEEQARASLRQALSILRAAFGDAAGAVLASTNETVTVLDSGVSTDLEAFEAALQADGAEALANLKDGGGVEFLEGLDVAEAPFEAWLAAEREKARFKVADLLRAVVDSVEASSRPDQAAGWLAALLRIEPADEEAHRRLMRLHLAQDRPDAALQQFDRCEAALRTCLDVAPSGLTVDLWREAKALRKRAKGSPQDTESGSAGPRPFLLAMWTDRGRNPLFESAVLAHGGGLVATPGDLTLASFSNAPEAIRAALDIRTQLRERSPEGGIDSAFALHHAEVDEPGEPHGARDIAALTRMLDQAPPGVVDVSPRFFQAVRRNSPCFFEDRSDPGDTGADPVFRATRPMWRQPFLAFHENPTPRLEKRPCSLAVAPIRYLGPNADSDQYLAEGLTEDLILELSRARRVQVSSRTTLEAIKSHDAVEIGQELGVGYVLFGSLRMVGRTIRLNFSLAETESGNVVWSDRFERRFDDLFDMLDDIVAKVVARIAGRIEEAEIAGARIKRPEANMTAYEYYLRGLWHHRMGGVTSEHSRKAVKWFRKAIEADSNFHRPRAMLCCAWSDLPDYDEERADRSAIRAFEADPTDPEAARIVAWVKFTKGEYDAGLRHADMSVELAPHDAYLLGRCAALYIFGGDPDKGLELPRRAAELDPFVPVYIVEERLSAYYAMGDYEKVVSEAQSLYHQTRRSRYYTAASLVALGRVEAAQGVVRTVLADDPALSLDYVVGQELYRDRDTLRTLLDRLSCAGVPDGAQVASDLSRGLDTLPGFRAQ